MANLSPLSKEPFVNLIGKIPERASSKKAASHWKVANEVSDNIETYNTSIKRKASELSLITGGAPSQRRAAEIDYLNNVIEQRKLIDKMNRASMSCLAQNYKENKISEQEFESQMRDITAKQNRLFNGDVIISRQRDRVLLEIDHIVVQAGKDYSNTDSFLATYFYNLLREELPGRDDEQVQWRRSLYKYYNAQPTPHGPVWYPITKTFGTHKSRRAAHLVPHKIGYDTMGNLYDDDGYKLMWSMGNGLLMERTFEEAFDEYQFCLLPREVAGKPDEWQLVLMDESLRNEIVYDGKTWDYFDKTFLQFQDGCDARPQKKFLYFHYWMCITKTQRELTLGWQRIREETKMGRLWSIPGPYLRKAMVRKLAASIGDYLLPEQEEIIKNSFEGSKVDDEREDISVKDIFSVLIPQYDSEDDNRLYDEDY